MPSRGLEIFDSDGAAAVAAVWMVPPTRLPAPPSALDGLALAPRFQRYDATDLRTTRLWFTAVAESVAA